MKLHGSLGMAAVAMLALGATAFAACGDDDDSSKTTPAAATAAPVSTSDTDVISAIQILDGAGFHGIDTSLNTDKVVPTTAGTTAVHMQALVTLTKWPTADLQKQADALAVSLGALASAVSAGDQSDIAKAGAAAKKAHDDEHAFSRATWTYLQEKAGIKTAAVATPAASSTAGH